MSVQLGILKAICTKPSFVYNDVKHIGGNGSLHHLARHGYVKVIGEIKQKQHKRFVWEITDAGRDFIRVGDPTMYRWQNVRLRWVVYGRDTPETSLTECQMEVLKLLANGMNMKEIAVQLGRSSKTIEYHRAQLSRKLKIHDIVSLTHWAIANEVVALKYPTLTPF